MSALNLLTKLAGPSRFSGAPFGVDIEAFCHALQARGGVGVYVTRDDRVAEAALRVASFMAPSLEIVSIPNWDTLPYDRVSPTAGVAAKRCAGLARLAQGAGKKPLLVVTTATALVQKAPAVETLKQASLFVSVGDEIDQKDLIEYLTINGYVRSGTVRERGEFAIRGGLIDLFPPTAKEPVRLDFFGDTLESIRTFDADTQLSVMKKSSFELVAMSEIQLNDAGIKRFRETYVRTFGATTRDDALY